MRLKPLQNFNLPYNYSKEHFNECESVTVKHYYEGTFSGMSIPAIYEFPHRIPKEINFFRNHHTYCGVYEEIDNLIIGRSLYITNSASRRVVAL